MCSGVHFSNQVTRMHNKSATSHRAFDGVTAPGVHSPTCPTLQITGGASPCRFERSRRLRRRRRTPMMSPSHRTRRRRLGGEQPPPGPVRSGASSPRITRARRPLPSWRWRLPCTSQTPCPFPYRCPSVRVPVSVQIPTSRTRTDHRGLTGRPTPVTDSPSPRVSPRLCTTAPSTHLRKSPWKFVQPGTPLFAQPSIYRACPGLHSSAQPRRQTPCGPRVAKFPGKRRKAPDLVNSATRGYRSV